MRIKRLMFVGFLYVASVSVIPELLAESRSGKQALKEVSYIRCARGGLLIVQYAAMAFGVFCMVSAVHPVLLARGELIPL